MGHKDAIRQVISNAWGISDKNFDLHLAYKNGVEDIEEINPKMVKANFIVNVTGKYIKPVYITVFVTVWGELRYQIDTSKVDTAYSPYIAKFVSGVMKNLSAEVKQALNDLKSRKIA